MNRLSVLTIQRFFKPIIIGAWLVTGIGLPLGIFWEFNASNHWLLYFKLYPHLILFSMIFLGWICLSLYRAIALIHNSRKLIRLFVITTLISIACLLLEITSNNVMLFELKQTAGARINLPPSQIEQIRKIPDHILAIQERVDGNTLSIRKVDVELALENFIQSEHQSRLDREQTNAFHRFMEISLAYPTWKDNLHNFSYSRWLYALAFFWITLFSLMNGLLFFAYSQRETQNPSKFISYLSISALLFSAWIPLRLYYNLIAKKLLFGFDLPISNLDVFVFVIYPIYLAVILLKLFEMRHDRLMIGLLIGTGILFPLIGRFSPEWINLGFGLQSHPIAWIVSLISSTAIFTLLNRRIA